MREELGVSSPYVKRWAENQQRVLAAYDKRRKDDMPPEELDSPARAAGDYLYQRASWHFYREEYKEALPLYEKAAAMPDNAICYNGARKNGFYALVK